MMKRNFLAAATALLVLAPNVCLSQQKPAPTPPPTTAPDSAGPTSDTPLDVPPKKEPTEVAPPAPAEEKVKNPDGEGF